MGVGGWWTAGQRDGVARAVRAVVVCVATVVRS